MFEPGQTCIVPPFRGRDVENMPHHTQCQIDGLGFDAGFSSHLDKRLQCSDVNRAKLQGPDEWIELPKVQRFIANPLLVLVLI